MIFLDGETWEHEKARLSVWHRKFIIWPRQIGVSENGRRVMACLLMVWRRGYYFQGWGGANWEWEYSLTLPDASPGGCSEG